MALMPCKALLIFVGKSKSESHLMPGRSALSLARAK